jgi:NTP pyrophosphatase (non-canonical NTP hydrolase)
MHIRMLQSLNYDRAQMWHKDQPWTILEWAGAMCGEAGEAANVAKKLRRISQGINMKEYNLTELREQLGEELADTLLYLLILAASEGIDLEQAAIKKFNRVSKAFKFPHRILDDLTGIGEGMLHYK